MNQQQRQYSQQQQTTQQLGGNNQVKRGGMNPSGQPQGQGPGGKINAQRQQQQIAQNNQNEATAKSNNNQSRRVIKLTTTASASQLQQSDDLAPQGGYITYAQKDINQDQQITHASSGSMMESAQIQPQSHHQFMFDAISQPAIFVRRNTENAKYTQDDPHRSGIYRTLNDESMKSSSNLSVNSQTFIRQSHAVGMMSQQYIDTTSSLGSTGEAISNNINRLSGWSGGGAGDMVGAGRNAFGFGRENSISSNDTRDRVYVPQDTQQIPQPAILNLQRLGSVRIMQKNIVYVIGLSPQIAREDVLRRYEYFSQYGKILTITINKESHMSDSGVCQSAYITFSQPHEAAIAILSSDQFVRDSRLIRASFGRTKYCKFFLRNSQCQNKDCPYMHELSTNTAEIITQGQNQNEASKKQFFVQCQKLAFQISGICEMTEQDFKLRLKVYREYFFPHIQTHPIFPAPEKIYEKKSLFKNYGHFMRVPLPESVIAASQLQNTGTKSVTSSSQASNQNNNKRSRKKNDETNNNEGSSVKNTSSKLVQYKVKGGNEMIRGMEEEDDVQATNLREPNKGSKLQEEGGLEYEEVKTLNSSIPYQTVPNRHLESGALPIVRPKRNNSSDERRKSKSPSPNQLNKKLANDLNQQLKAHIEKTHIDNSTEGKTFSHQQEKQRENYYGDEDNGSDGGYHSQTRSQSIFYRQRRGSFHSTLVVESLKFLNDDTDVVPKKRGEPLFAEQQFKTSPPSEVFNMPGGIGTPVPSMLGGQLDDDYHWNSTIMSNQELYIYQQAYGGFEARGSMLGFAGAFDNKSFYSQNVPTNDLSMRPQSSNLNTTMEQMRNTTTTNSGMYPYYNGGGMVGCGGSSSQQPQFSQDGSGRYQMIAGPNFSQQFAYTGQLIPQGMNYEVGTNLMTRSPSQPHFAGTNVHKHSLSNQKLAAVAMNSSYNHMNLRTPQASGKNPTGEFMHIPFSGNQDIELRSLQSQYPQQLTPMSKQPNDIHSQTPRAPSSKAMGQEQSQLVSMTPQRLHQDQKAQQTLLKFPGQNLQNAKKFNLNLDLQPAFQTQLGGAAPVQAPQAMSAREPHNPHQQNSQHSLSKHNLEIFNKYNQASKELLYAKIFIQGDNPGVQSKNNIFCSQSLFCYNLSQFEEEKDTKYSGKHVPNTPVKGGIGMVKRGLIASGMLEQLGGADTGTVSGMLPSIDGEDYDYRLHYTSEREDDNLTMKTSEYRAYHQDALNRESFISGQYSGPAGIGNLGDRTSTLPDNASSTDEYCRSSMQSTGGKKKRSESRPCKERKQSYVGVTTGGGGGPDTPRELGQSKSSRKEW